MALVLAAASVAIPRTDAAISSGLLFYCPAAAAATTAADAAANYGPWDSFHHV